MSVLELRELGSDERRDAALLDLFQHCREHVERVATGAAISNFIATTTRKGFIQLIDLSSGEYCLFLTHLNGIPLDSSLRCFALAPPNRCGSQKDSLFLVFSLAYSNELVVANMRTGSVEILDTCTTRPSVAICDETYVACGEGCGRVVMWRAHQPHDDGRTPPEECLTALSLSRLWCSTLFDDAVVCLRTSHSYLIAASADYRCVIVSAEGGEVLSTLAYESDCVTTILPLTQWTAGVGLALCTSRQISVYGSCTSAKGGDDGVQSWIYLGGVTWARAEGRCATSLADIVACGTASGLILLYRCSHSGLNGALQELVRFDVGYGVVGLQLYDSNELVVVTNAGDVWKWPLRDLLPSAAVTPEPSAELRGDCTEPQPDNVAPRPTSQTTTADATAKATPKSALCDAASQCTRTQNDTVRDGTQDALPEKTPFADIASSRASDGGDVEEEVVVMTDAEEEDRGGATNGLASGSGAMPSGDAAMTRDSDGGAGIQGENEPTAVAQLDRAGPGVPATQTGQGTAVESCPCAQDEAMHREDDILINTDEGSALHEATRMVTREELHNAPQLLRQLGPPVVLEHLRKGRRMNPQMVASLLADDDDAPDDTSTATSSLAVAELQSTQLLLQQQAALEEASFDVSQYISSHPLDADGLQYQHPVRLLSFGRHDRVFAGVTPALQDITHCAVLPKSRRAASPSGRQDDLAAATLARLPRPRNAAWEAERSRHGPCIASHQCKSVLCAEDVRTSSVIFDVAETVPSLPRPLLLPMPLPPTPSLS